MKKLFSAAALASALSIGTTFAAEPLAVKELPPPPPPPPIWTGFYFGLNVGGTWTVTDNGFTVVSSPGPCNAAFPGCVSVPNASQLTAGLANFTQPLGSVGGFLGGGQVGYNWQFARAFVAGVEADIQGVAGNGGDRTPFIGAIQDPNFVDIYTQTLIARKSVGYIGTVRGRLGYLPAPTLLVYGTAGLSYGGVDSRVDIMGSALNDAGLPFPYFATGSFSDTRIGWTAGGGIEWLFWPNWSAKAEYLYYDLGNVTYSTSPLINFGGPLSAAPGGVYSSVFPQIQTRFNGHIVRAGVNYHLNWITPAPVAAKF